MKEGDVVTVTSHSEGGNHECHYAILDVARVASTRSDRVSGARRKRGYLDGNTTRVCCVHALRTASSNDVAHVLKAMHALVIDLPVDLVGGVANEHAYSHSFGRPNASHHNAGLSLDQRISFEGFGHNCVLIDAPIADNLDRVFAQHFHIVGHQGCTPRDEC